MNRFMIIAAASVASVSLSSVAFADDFVALCTGADKSPETEKSCTCAAEKLTGAERAGALEAMKAVNAALTSGKPEDAAAISTTHAKGLEAVMTAQVSCM